ncbi:hypothetical protein DK095_190017 [Flavobacterium psychrophilum]|nr:hypothetical protein DK095_190017 [Flavobacterium psychrophilum]SNB05484.1 hypothetical protein JIP0899_1530005 [Flavobacterium psychrophilum]SNB18898.1 hypothetical protein JIP1600_3140002 [Flavobacterium psychrophilum]SNB95489.1 hypothetical protein FPC840_1430002 [Flavobacterium psychrophilum]
MHKNYKKNVNAPKTNFFGAFLCKEKCNTALILKTPQYLVHILLSYVCVLFRIY